jgi:hypothetical protein
MLGPGNDPQGWHSLPLARFPQKRSQHSQSSLVPGDVSALCYSPRHLHRRVSAGRPRARRISPEPRWLWGQACQVRRGWPDGPPRWRIARGGKHATAGQAERAPVRRNCATARRLAGLVPVVAAVAVIAAPEAFRQLCRDELAGVYVAADSWDIRARWFGVVICATPRLGVLDRGITIPWRVIAAQIALVSRNMSQQQMTWSLTRWLTNDKMDERPGYTGNPFRPR